MNNKSWANKPAIRYSKAFQMEIVLEMESQGTSVERIRRKYGIRGCGTVENWLRKYGNGSRGKILRIETPHEIQELKTLRERVRRLESALADANLDLALERSYLRLACERAGIADVEGFKKKAVGRRPTGRLKGAGNALG